MYLLARTIYDILFFAALNIFVICSKLSAPEISFDPKKIDFGLMDSDTTSQSRILVLRNDGSKIARFFIDATSRDRKLVAEPRRGIVQVIN